MAIDQQTATRPPSWRSPGVRGDVEAALNAFRGLLRMIRTQHAFRLQMLVSALYAVLARYRNVSAAEWVVSVLAVAAVLAAETINTAIESVCDFIHAEHHEEIGIIKDLAAGAVLIFVLAALSLGSAFLIWPQLI